MRPILFRQHRSEQDDSDDGSCEVIEVILNVRGKVVESLTGAWWHMEGQMMKIPVALCRLIENIRGDISYVLIEGLMWKT